MGKLDKISDKNGNFIDLTYGRDGHLQKLVDNFNRKMYFTFNVQGFIEKIQGENSKECQYKYNNNGELVWAKDTDGSVYTYKYDAEKRHNMTEIGYPDKTTMQLTYYPYAQFENVKTVKDRDGTLTEYKYVVDSSDKHHYTVTVAVKNSDGKKISDSQYEYINRVKSDGEEWTYKMVTVLTTNVADFLF
jgi:YD repeat-containing protein